MQDKETAGTSGSTYQVTDQVKEAVAKYIVPTVLKRLDETEKRMENNHVIVFIVFYMA